ncbi:MAG: hypothetical protein QOG34_539 [Frankiaceae bacterium]|nr:hypothetical protein [Frankiaceae bacterium]
MRKTIRKAASVAIATALLTLAAPLTSANADYGDTIKGGCGFAALNNSTLTGGANNTGVIYDVSVSQEQNGLPSGATVQCWIEVNGVYQLGTDIFASGNPIQDNAQQIMFNAYPGDSVALCQSVSFWDPSTWTAPDGNVGIDCQPATSIGFPPQALIDAVNTVLDLADKTLAPTLCPLFMELYQITGGGVLGVIHVQPDGDLYLAKPLGVDYYQIYDCAPFGNGSGTGLPVDQSTIYEKLPPIL